MSEALALPISARRRVAAYLELTKPRLTALVLVTVAAGFAAAHPGAIDPVLLLKVVLGVGLVAGGASALNMYLERDLDAKMNRTRNRPLPACLLPAAAGLAFGVSLSVSGLAYVYWVGGELPAFLSALSFANYVFVYTPLKRVTSFNTLVGAVTGALPPMIGWTAATGSLEPGAWILFAILFVWQMPHFLTIAWLAREDYARAGMKMISVVDPEGGMTMKQIALYSVLQIPVSLLPFTSGLAGYAYLGVATVLGIACSVLGLAFAFTRSRKAARYLFLASLLYIPIVLGTLTLDRIGS